MSKLKMKRFPGDTIVVPMLIGVVLNSFVPQLSLIHISPGWLKSRGLERQRRTYHAADHHQRTY